MFKVIVVILLLLNLTVSVVGVSLLIDEGGAVEKAVENAKDAYDDAMD